MDPRFELEFECHEAWEEMREVEPGQRRCERCSETVVDLSRMTKKKALALVTSDQPPCVNYLVVAGEPVFLREVRRGSLLAAAAGLLAACSAPAEPACSLSPEPTDTSLSSPSLLDPGAPFGSLHESSPAVTSAAGAPSAGAPQSGASSASHGGGPASHGGGPASHGADEASAGDPNDVDGVTPTPASTNGAPPPMTRVPHMTRGRIARYRVTAPPPPVNLGRR